MQNKGRRWTDIQLIISSISIAIAVGFWGFFASREKLLKAVRAEAALPMEPEVASTPVPMLLPGQVLYLGAAAPQTPAPISNRPKPKRKRGGGGGDGGGGGGGGAGGTGSS